MTSERAFHMMGPQYVELFLPSSSVIGIQKSNLCISVIFKWSTLAVGILQALDRIKQLQKIIGINYLHETQYMWYVTLFKRHICHSQLHVSAKFNSTHKTSLNYQPLFGKGVRTPLLREEHRPSTREPRKSSLTQTMRWQDCENCHRATTWYHSLLTTHPATCTARIPRFSLRPLRKIVKSDPVSIVQTY